MHYHTKLLIHAINHLVEKNLLELSCDDDNNEERIKVKTEILGKSSYIIGYGIGYGEIRITLYWGCSNDFLIEEDDYDYNIHRRGYYKHKEIDCACSVFLSRKDEPYMQGDPNRPAFSYYTSRKCLDYLYRLPIPETLNYKHKGKHQPFSNRPL